MTYKVEDKFSRDVLSKLGISPDQNSWQADLYLPGIRGALISGKTVDETADIFKEHADKWRGKPPRWAR